MSNQLEKLIQETFGDLDALSPDQMRRLIQEAIKAFSSLKDKSLSSDPKDRDEAFKIAMSLKQVVQNQTEEICKKAGIEPALFASLAEQENEFNAETWSELNTAKKELEEMRQEPGRQRAPDSAKKPHSSWILG